LKILIIGSTGQLGSDIIKLLSQKKNYAIACYNKNEINLSLPGFTEKLQNEKFNYIINCSAVHDLDYAQKNIAITYQVNSNAVEELSTYCNNNNSTLIHFSTDYVFDGFLKNREYREDDEAIPINIYGSSKISGEKKINKLCKNYYIFRVSSLFGKTPPSGKKYNFVDAIINKCKNIENISVVDDQISKPTSTLYIANVISEIIERPIKKGLYHLTNDQSLSFYDYAVLILKILKKNYHINRLKYKELNFIVERPKFSSLDNTKLSSFVKTNNSLELYLEKYIKEKYYER
jgi:dTDP-4-dehydrorhamnose reductase